MSPGFVPLRLDAPPEVVGVGVGRHGVRERIEHWLLPELHSVHLYDYHADVVVADVAYPIQPGALSIVPAGTPMEFRYRGSSEHVYAHLRLPRRGRTVSAPIMHNLGDEADSVRARLTAIIAASAARRSAELWALLWRAATGPTGPDPGAGPDHPAIGAATAYIEANLARRITVERVAGAAHVSASHLNRLFRTGFGIGVAGYIRRRRTEQVEHLLRDTTQSIGSVAASIGIGDLQAFNKFCRARLGASPRRLRDGRG